MKKTAIFIMTVILALSAVGCGCRNSNMPETTPSTTPNTTPATTAPTTAPATTAPTVMPDMPEFETNIPDPTVNDNSTDDFTDNTETTQDNARSRMRRHVK